jgi:uncharacterized protein
MTLSALLLSLHLAAGPSFHCARATTPTEKAICGAPELGALDRRLADAYRKSRVDFLDARLMLEDLELEQRAWLVERDACGAAVACVQARYQERLDVLEYRPDPRHPSATDGFVGRFHTATGSVRVQRHGKDLRVAIEASEPTHGAWVCQVFGEATLDGKRLRLVSADGPALLLERTATGVTVSEQDGAASAPRANEAYCGAGGHVTDAYRRD